MVVRGCDAGMRCHRHHCCAACLAACALPAADSKVTWPIHREAPLFVEQEVEQKILATGIKVRFWALAGGAGGGGWPQCSRAADCLAQRSVF